MNQLPITSDAEDQPVVSPLTRLIRWLTPDTRMKRWTYAGLIAAVLSQVYIILGWVALPMLTLSVLYYIWQGLLRLREHILWKVRNRILVSFIFVGVVPLCVVFLIGILIGWFWIGTIGSNMIARHFESTVDRLDHLPHEIQLALFQGPPDAGLPTVEAVEQVLAANQDLPDLMIEVFEGDTLVYGYPASGMRSILPDWLREAGHFADVVSDSLASGEIILAFRAGDDISIRGRDLYVLASMPLGEAYQLKLWEDTGTLISYQTLLRRGILSAIGNDDLQVEWSTLPYGLGEMRLPWGTTVAARWWEFGVTDPVFLGAYLDPIRIFKDAIRVDTTLIRILLSILIFLCMILICVELTSFLIGLVVSRRITTAVHGLSEGTQAIRAGNLNYRVDVERRDQLGELSRSFNAMANSIQLLLNEVGEKERIEAELAMARDVQALFIPKESPQSGRLELVGTWIPARTVSGDYYDFIEHQNRVLDIVVGDISGKGMSAALMMAGLQASLRSQSLNEELDLKPGRLSTLMARLNVYLCHNTAPEKFATLFMCSYDVEASSLTYCCAGHNPPFLFQKGQDEPVLLEAGGCPIGMFSDWTYDEGTITVGPEDLFVIYTDGITEAHNKEEEEFGEERLQQVILDHRDRPCEEIQDRILASVRDFSLGAEQFDDQTLVIGRVT